MKMKKGNFLLTMISIMIFHLTAWCGDMHRFHLGNNDGLLSNYIRDISQDGHGFIWVATDNGLNRFDGTSFTGFTKENSGLSSNELNCVLADPRDKDVVFFGTRHDGMCRYDYKTGEITQVKDSIQSPDIPFLSPSSDGGIWVTNYHFVPDKYDPVTGRVERLFKTRPESFPRNSWCAVEDRDGRHLYVGHVYGGLSKVRLSDRSFVNYRHEEDDANSIADNTVYIVMTDTDGKVWCGTGKGVSMLDPATGRFTNFYNSNDPVSIQGGYVMAIQEMQNGDIWFGTSEGGVSVLTAESRSHGRYEFLNHAWSDSLDGKPMFASSFIRALFEDSFGNKWVGNYNKGIDVVSHQPPFFIFDDPFPERGATSRHSAVTSVIYDSDGVLWIGGENEILRYDGNSVSRIALPSVKRPIQTSCRSLLRDSRGMLWIGTDNSGVYRYNPGNGVFTDVAIPSREVDCLYEDSDGSVWIGSHDGLYRSTDGNRAEAMSVYNSKLKDMFIKGLLRDETGRLWVGTFGQGLTAFDKEGKVVAIINADNGLPTNAVNALYADSRNNLWVSTRSGAVRIPIDNLSEAEVIDGEAGLVNSDVKAIEEDKDGNIWMSTNLGLACYDYLTRKVAVYERTYSSPLVGFVENASCLGPGNQIFFGGQNGLVHFGAGRIKTEPEPSRITLTGIIVHGRDERGHDLEITIPVNSDKVILPYNQNTFTLYFNNLDITQAANSDYQYNMKGVNDVWTKVNDRNEAIYRNLNPGKYEFRIRYRLNGGEWSDPQALASVIIEPPLYLTWWAKILYVVAFLVIVFVVVWFYKRKLELEKNLAIEREMSKNSRILNEERLVFFTNITHELRTPLSLIVGPIEDLINDEGVKDEHRRKLHTIRTSSMRLLNLINGILEFRKTETRNRNLEVIEGNLANYVREIGLRFKELNNNKDVLIQIDVAEMEGRELYYDPEMINTIINNLMSNAMKYTKEGRITLSLRPEERQGVRYVILSVADTGVGISKAALPHVFQRYYQAENARKVSGTGIGLALTKNLVELHEAEIYVESEEGKGSTFSVRLLMDNSYPTAKHREVTGASPETETTASIEEEPDNKLVILVVEDDRDVRDYIAESFGDDYKVMTAADGREGLERARSAHPDIVVSDVMMPEMDGMELCKVLKSDFQTSHIPVILLTAKDTLTDKEEGYESGADSYITKPFSAKLLRSRINNIMETRHKIAVRLFEPLEIKNKIEVELSETVASGGNILTSLDKEFLAKFKGVIEENLTKVEIDVNFLCDKMCMSNSTLYRKVKGISGLSPNEFIRKTKLQKAAGLLREGNTPLVEIPELSGFGNPQYFRRLFKQEFGVSPTEYIQKYSGDKCSGLSGMESLNVSE